MAFQDVERAFAYTLLTKSLFAFLPPALWAAQLGGQKRYGAAPQTLFSRDCSSCRGTRSPAMCCPCSTTSQPPRDPETFDSTVRGPCTCHLGRSLPRCPSSDDQLPPAKAHRSSTYPATSPIHKCDLKGFNFALTNLSLASNYRTGGLC